MKESPTNAPNKSFYVDPDTTYEQEHLSETVKGKILFLSMALAYLNGYIHEKYQTKDFGYEVWGYIKNNSFPTQEDFPISNYTECLDLLEEVKNYSIETGGWIINDYFVELPEWERMFNDRNS